MWELGSCKSASNDHTSGSVCVILFCVVRTHGLLGDSVAEDVNMPRYTFTRQINRKKHFLPIFKYELKHIHMAHGYKEHGYTSV